MLLLLGPGLGLDAVIAIVDVRVLRCTLPHDRTDFLGYLSGRPSSLAVALTAVALATVAILL